MKRFARVLVPLAVAVTMFVPSAAAHGATVNYVALGDSYSSGVGTNHYDLSSSCDRSSLSYPALVAAAKGYTLNFQACSGATTTDVINSQIAALNSGTGLVTVTAGGNDVGFVNLLISCTLSNCVSSLNSTTSSLNTSLAPKLDAMDAQIKSHAPNAKVIVLGYPHLFSGTCFSALGISSSEVTASNNLANAIDTLTQTEATKYGFTYKSAIAQFTNHGVCASSAWLHGIDLNPVTDSYHPTATGYSSGYAPLVRAVTG